MCENCDWKVIVKKAHALSLKKGFSDRGAELHDFITTLKANKHVTPENIEALNKLINTVKDTLSEASNSGKGNFDPLKILMDDIELISNHKNVPNDGFYKWDKSGVWNKIQEDYIHKTLMNYITKSKASQLYELKKFFDILTLINEDQEMNFNKDYINMKNVMYNLKTRVTSYHDKNFLSTVQIPIEYDSDADCPRWKQFVSEVTEDEEKVRILQEFMGYCLTPMTKFEKCLILVGTGANGKSTFTNVFKKIIGEQNISHIGMMALTDKFSRSCLLNKLVNVATELEAGEVAQTDYFKQIVSGETIDASFKFKDIFHFKPFCKLVFSMNNMPHLRDKSAGLFRRLLIVEFPKSFEHNPNKNLYNELLEEKSGIFNWALEGLQRLLDNDKFTESSKAQEDNNKYRIQNNSVMGYCNESIEILSQEDKYKYPIEKLLFYTNYKNWCLDHGLKPSSCISMYRDMKNIYKDKIDDAHNVYLDGKRKTVIYGIQYT